MKRGKAEYWVNFYDTFAGPYRFKTARKLYSFINSRPSHVFHVLRWSGKKYHPGDRTPSGITVYGSSLSGVSWERVYKAGPKSWKKPRSGKRVRK